jgi:hypothetical protein
MHLYGLWYMYSIPMRYKCCTYARPPGRAGWGQRFACCRAAPPARGAGCSRRPS